MSTMTGPHPVGVTLALQVLLLATTMTDIGLAYMSEPFLFVMFGRPGSGWYLYNTSFVVYYVHGR